MGNQALFSSVSGLQVHDTWLDVIGNNVANANSTGYKSSRVTFRDQLNQTIHAGSGNYPGSQLGGVNPLQIGLGTRIQSIQTIFLQGPIQSTTSNLDLAIEGNGFLMVQKGENLLLTRSGRLTLDGMGYLVDANGGLVQGYNATTAYNSRVLNSFSGTPGQALTVTDASVVLRTDDPSRLTAIRVEASMTIPPKATTQVTFQGNLDAFLQVNQEGGIYDLAPGGRPVLPIAGNIFLFPPGIAVDPSRIVPQFLPGGGFAIQQVSNMSSQISFPILNGGIDMAWVQIFSGNYAWEQSPPLKPAEEVQTQIFDSHGNPRELTVQFYQVNDLGAMGVNSASGPSQALYAWYAFDTSDGAKPATSNLVGGTGIMEGEMTQMPNQFWYDRGRTTPGPSGMGDLYIGDFIWFNTDGSIATTGGCGGPVPTPPGVPNYMAVPRVYLPMTNDYNPPRSPYPSYGAEIMAIDLNFGTFGLLTDGKRDGLTCDAAGSYQTVNGVLEYVPNASVYVSSQDGYTEGRLEGLSWSQDGRLQGQFSNEQIVDLAQLVLADVQNPDGMLRTGDSNFMPSINSGEMRVGLASQGTFGTVRGYALEGSNVDLASELTNMVVAQRGLQASARVMSDEASIERTATNIGQ